MYEGAVLAHTLACLSLQPGNDQDIYCLPTHCLHLTVFEIRMGQVLALLH